MAWYIEGSRYERSAIRRAHSVSLVVDRLVSTTGAAFFFATQQHLYHRDRSCYVDIRLLLLDSGGTHLLGRSCWPGVSIDLGHDPGGAIWQSRYGFHTGADAAWSQKRVCMVTNTERWPGYRYCSRLACRDYFCCDSSAHLAAVLYCWKRCWVQAHLSYQRTYYDRFHLARSGLHSRTFCA